VCAEACTALRTPAGAPLRQRASDGAWRVVASNGTLTLRAGDEVLWSGSTASSLRLRLSTTSERRDVARVLGHHHRWGALEFGQWAGADCTGRQVCVNARVPSVERYLRGLAEMPSSWANAALAAQAVVGRTFALRMLDRGVRPACRCHLLASAADQVYVGLDKEEGLAGERWTARVRATAGNVVRYRGALAATFYSSSHGHRSERVSDSYAFSAPLASYPYLRSVSDPWSGDERAANPYRRWTATLGNREVAGFVDHRLRRLTGVQVRSRTAGRTPRELLVTGLDRTGTPLTVLFAGRDGKHVGDDRTWIAGAELKQRFGLRSQQITRIGFTPFVDDDGTVHEYAMLALAAAGVVDGCRADRSCHADGLSRAQAAALLARALQLPAADRDRFGDATGSVHADDIEAAAAAGIVKGCTTDRFCPGRVLRRAQMASLLSRALELPATGADAFTDDGDSVHEDSINRLAAAGITLGGDDGRFRPRGGVTRGQMASFLERGLEEAAGG
jgi:SpoIID/LytB domain protein